MAKRKLRSDTRDGASTKVKVAEIKVETVERPIAHTAGESSGTSNLNNGDGSNDQAVLADAPIVTEKASQTEIDYTEPHPELFLPVEIVSTPSQKISFNAPFYRKSDYLILRNDSNHDMAFAVQSPNTNVLIERDSEIRILEQWSATHIKITCDFVGTPPVENDSIIVEYQNVPKGGMKTSFACTEGIAIKKSIKVEYNV